MENIEDRVEIIFSRDWKQAKRPELWDGKTADRIVDLLKGMEI
jgi:hypothetical protein